MRKGAVLWLRYRQRMTQTLVVTVQSPDML
jgi:hypothetical protein